MKFKQAFNKAVSLGENLYEDGSVNWNYVDADLYMEFGPKHTEINERYLSELHYEMFELLADAYEKANGVQKQQDTIVDTNNGIFSEYITLTALYFLAGNPRNLPIRAA